VLSIACGQRAGIGNKATFRVGDANRDACSAMRSDCDSNPARQAAGEAEGEVGSGNPDSRIISSRSSSSQISDFRSAR